MHHSKDICSHKFIIQILDDLKPVFKRVEPGKTKLRSKSPLELSPTEFYTWNVFEKITPISDAIIRMRHADHFLGTFPNAAGYEKKSITRDKWIEYHLSYFIVILASILDLCLLLTNSVFRLGIPERLCTLELITKNEWVKVTKVPKALRSLDKVIEDHRKLRNLHVHRGKIPEISELLDDDLYEHLRLISFIQSIKSLGIDRKTITQGYRATTKELRAHIGIDISLVINSVTDVLDTLHSSYITNLERVSKTDAL